MAKRFICTLITIVAVLALTQVASAALFTPGSLFFASTNVNHGTVYDISGGGDLSGATAFAEGVRRNDGQLAWSTDRTVMYATTQNSGIVNAVDASGSVSTYCDGFATNTVLTGIVHTRDGRLLVASYFEGTVYDITNPANATTFAQCMGWIRNLVELPSGEILAAGEGEIWDITSGTPTVWATLPGRVADIDYTSTGRVFASVWTDADGIYEVTGGGTPGFSYTKFAWTNDDEHDFRGLAIDRQADRILAAPAHCNMVYDITSGGQFSVDDPSSAWAYNIPTTNDAALDFVPFSASVPEPSTLLIWGLLGLFGIAWKSKTNRQCE